VATLYSQPPTLDYRSIQVSEVSVRFLLVFSASAFCLYHHRRSSFSFINIKLTQVKENQQTNKQSVSQPSGAQVSASPMIQDFQQTTVASIGLLAHCSGQYCLHICLRQSSQPRRRASPAIAIQSKNCTASAAVAQPSSLESREVAKTMRRPLVARACGEWRLTVSRWSPC